MVQERPMYDGTPVDITDEESHRDKVMYYVEGDGVSRWVFEEDLDDPVGTPPGAVALDEGRTPEEAEQFREEVDE